MALALDKCFKIVLFVSDHLDELFEVVHLCAHLELILQQGIPAHHVPLDCYLDPCIDLFDLCELLHQSSMLLSAQVV